MFTVLTETDPPGFWLVCGGCSRRWELEPDALLLPQTRRVFEEHGECARATADGVTVEE